MQKLNIDKFQNAKYSELAKELFKGKGFLIFRNFIDNSAVNTLKKKYGDKNNLKLLPPGNDYHQFFVKYFYPNRTRDLDVDLNKIVKNVFKKRIEIDIQRTSDQHLLSYILRWNINVSADDGFQALIDHQLSHTFYRIALYSNGNGQFPHHDNPGELQAIIPLSKKGLDYQEGGLVVFNEEDKVDIDEKVNPGDLIILNAYYKKHAVEPVVCSENQLGRMHIFIPMIPDYYYNGGPSLYHFGDNRFKFFFSIPNMHWTMKLMLIFKEFVKILTFRSNASDSSTGDYLK